MTDIIKLLFEWWSLGAALLLAAGSLALLASRMIDARKENRKSRKENEPK